jgi:Zn-dependent peptidase ImmA (M78 family)
MDKGLIFENLLHVAKKQDVNINICGLKANYGLLKGKRIALNIGMGMDKMNYTLAHELAHLFLHADQGDTIHSDKHEE